MFSFVSLVIFRYGFEGESWVLIVPVPRLYILVTYMQSLMYVKYKKYLIKIVKFVDAVFPIITLLEPHVAMETRTLNRSAQKSNEASPTQ